LQDDDCKNIRETTLYVERRRNKLNERPIDLAFSPSFVDARQVQVWSSDTREFVTDYYAVLNSVKMDQDRESSSGRVPNPFLIIGLLARDQGQGQGKSKLLARRVSKWQKSAGSTRRCAKQDDGIIALTRQEDDDEFPAFTGAQENPGLFTFYNGEDTDGDSEMVEEVIKYFENLVDPEVEPTLESSYYTSRAHVMQYLDEVVSDDTSTSSLDITDAFIEQVCDDAETNLDEEVDLVEVGPITFFNSTTRRQDSYTALDGLIGKRNPTNASGDEEHSLVEALYREDDDDFLAPPSNSPQDDEEIKFDFDAFHLARSTSEYFDNVFGPNAETKNPAMFHARVRPDRRHSRPQLTAHSSQSTPNSRQY
jgi:hypothetical protein